MSDPVAGSSLVSVDELWADGWRGPSVLRINCGSIDYLAPLSAAAHRIVAHVPGTVFPGFTDSHVHLGLIDSTGLVEHGIARVLDLGWEPQQASGWLSASQGQAKGRFPEVEIAGAFLTAPGGYPSTRPWAPPGSVREVSTPTESASAIAEMKKLGASVIKITLNTVAGPVWSDDLLNTVVEQAHRAGLPVVAHTEGAGQAVRAVRAGSDLLAHTPWTERFTDDEIAYLAVRSSWISTLDIHGWGDYGDAFAVALNNLSRFVHRGGRVLYGTDLGNGPTPVGVNVREIEALIAAGLSIEQVVEALIPRSRGAILGSNFGWIPGSLPLDRTEWTNWLSTVQVVLSDEIEERFG